MARASEEAKALAAIERQGALLVYPIANRKDVPSLWSVLYPRSEMQWAWDADADPRVASLWLLRERLARTRRVVYTKWYRGRAVFFSQPLFTAMLSVLRPWQRTRSGEASELLALLEEDSPQSSKLLRQHAGLRGKAGERRWTRATKELWEQLLVVGTGEVPDGAFPSLEMGATRWIFEALWEEAQRGEQRPLLDQLLPVRTPFGKFWAQTLRAD
ncbi:MAG TPA: hypothetical protein VI299_21525 [Polyangiales bacterium]